MDCGRCGTPNRDDARFCAGCGAELARTCTECGRDLADDARFCDGCGAPVEAASPSSGAVRKVVTAMFCDLGGSTGFGERVDAESARSVIGRYHALLQEVVDAHDGTVAKFIGDGMLAFFGIPEVAEDDAERAVAAAAEMQRRFGEFAASVAERYGETLTFRIGVNSGEVVIAEGDADVVGDALNVAARLEKACEPGRVTVGEATWRLTRGSFEFEPLGEVTVKGRAEPVAAYVLAQEATTEQATPFVGREPEVRRLRAAFDGAVADRAAHVVTVIGPPGVGKTRLSRELEEALAEEATVLSTACELAGGTTFAPVVDLLRPRVGPAGDDGTTSREQLASLVPPDEPERDRIVDGLAGLVGVDEARSTEETFWAVRRLVESMARATPLVVVLDDIQWAASLFLDLLEHLAEWVTDAPVLLVGLARPEIRSVRPVLAEPGRRRADVIVLGGLDAEATAQLATRMLGGGGLPAELQARLPASTDGNPLFVRELVRMLVDEAIIRQDGDTWRLTVDVESIEVPPTIRSLLASRIERLPEPERTVLERASILGTDFTLGGLRALVDGGDPVDQLERLRRRDMVEPTGAYLGDEPLYRFHHVLIRDAVYSRLLKEARAALHERAATYTRAATAGLVGEHETAIAHHYEQAHDYLRQLGSLDDHGRDLGRQAAELLTIAAHRALDRDDLVAAGELARRALDRLEDTEPATRADLLLLGCEALLASGELTAAAELVDELRGLGAGSPRLAAWVDTYVAQLLDLAEPERLDEAEALVLAAAERFTDLGEPSGQAKAHLVHAGLMARQGRVAESERELDQAMAAARAADDQRRLVAVFGETPSAALWGPSPVPQAAGRILDVIRLVRITAASPSVEATSTRHQAVLEALRGRFDTGRTLLADARRTVEELGLRRDLMEVELFAGIIELLAGDPRAAEVPLRAAHAGLDEMGAGADAALAAAHLARGLLAQGRVDDAEAAAAASERAAGQDLKAGIASRTVRAQVLALRGEVADAVVVAEAAVALAADTDLVLDHADAWSALAEVRSAAGDEAGAEAARGEADRLHALKGTVGTAGRGARSSALTESDDLGNMASRKAVRFAHTWTRVSVEAAGDMVTDDVVWIDARTGVGVVNEGREAVVENLRAITEVLGDEEWRIFEVLAERGEGLSLVRQGIDGDDFKIQILTVTEYDTDGLNCWAIFLDDDAMPRALAELEQRHLSRGVDSGENLALRVARVSLARWMAGGPDAVRDLYSPSVRFEDRRLGVGGDSEGIEAMVATLREVSDLLGDSTFQLEEVLAQRGERMALVRQAVVGEAELSMLSLVELNDTDRIGRVVIFDVDDLAAALDELDARHVALEG